MQRIRSFGFRLMRELSSLSSAATGAFSFSSLSFVAPFTKATQMFLFCDQGCNPLQTLRKK